MLQEKDAWLLEDGAILTASKLNELTNPPGPEVSPKALALVSKILSRKTTKKMLLEATRFGSKETDFYRILKQLLINKEIEEEEWNFFWSKYCNNMYGAFLYFGYKFWFDHYERIAIIRWGM